MKAVNWTAVEQGVRRIIAKRHKLDVAYLERKWRGKYDPETHLFSRERGGPTTIWFLEQQTWQNIASAYCQWMRVSHATFWEDVYGLLQNSRDWKVADLSFRLWVLNQVTIGLQSGILKNHPLQNVSFLDKKRPTMWSRWQLCRSQSRW